MMENKSRRNIWGKKILEIKYSKRSESLKRNNGISPQK